MRDLDRPRLFDNRVCYRLLGAEPMPAGEAATLTFGHMRYFDMIDVGEALAHELARTSMPTAPSAPTSRHGRTCPSAGSSVTPLTCTPIRYCCRSAP
jgi:hypothetical protein